MSDQKICPTCSTEYPLSERFCPRDGMALRSAIQSTDLLGAVIADRYHILKKLGEGGMGTVYLAEHVKMGRKSALKVMNPGMNTDADAIARFNREASNASRLSHPNICGIYDFGETTDGIIYLAMEFIEGSSLSALIEQSGQLPAHRAASIVHQTADALQVAHDAGIVHRDLKPDNIMVAKNRDGSDLVKVVDFGIAKASSSDAQNVTKTGMVVGTPEYMSPEQLVGDKLDGRSDIYSLGLVAFNCLTGMLPFAADSAQEAMIMRLTDTPRSLANVIPAVPWPPSLQGTLDKALALDIKDRYSSAAVFGREFAAAIADMPTTQAVEAGTMLLNAAAQVPETRVNAPRPSATSEPIDLAGAAKPPLTAKSGGNGPVLAGIGGGLALVVGVGLYLSGLLGSGPPEPSAEIATPGLLSPSLPSQGAADSTAQQTQGNTSALQGGPMRAPETAIRPGTPVTKAMTNPTPTAPGGGLPTQTPAGPSITSRLIEWLDQIQANLESKVVARRVLGELEGVRPGLSGRNLAEWHFVELNALMVMGDSEACRSARDVKRLHTDPSRLAVANATLNDESCM